MRRALTFTAGFKAWTAALVVAFIAGGCATGTTGDPEPSPEPSVDAGADAGAIAPVCLEEPDEDEPNRYFRRHHLRFVNDDEGVEITITRDFVDVGVGESAIYSLERFSLRTPGIDECVVDEGALDYVNSHHNWIDDAIVDIDGITYTLEMRFQLDGSATWTDTLTGVDTDDNVVFGPMVVVENSGVLYR